MKQGIIAFCLFLGVCAGCHKDDKSPAAIGRWEKGPDWAIDSGYVGFYPPVSFQIGGELYVGIGYQEFRTGSSFNRSLKRYSPLALYGHQTAEFPGRPRVGAVSFVIGEKAYVGLGRTIREMGLSEGEYCKDLWVYDSKQDTWDSIPCEFPGEGMTDAFAFSLDGVGYVGGGQRGSEILGEFYVFIPERPEWAGDMQRTFLPRTKALTFNCNGTVYMGFNDADKFARDFYKFDAEQTDWSALTSFLPDVYPGLPRTGASAFVLPDEKGKDYAYVVGGNISDTEAVPCWEACRYDPEKDLWEEVSGLPVKTMFRFVYAYENTVYIIAPGGASYRFVKE